ncbi:hypothetical protein BJX99DRAFT_235214 [Aspergillus californicus]
MTTITGIKNPAIPSGSWVVISGVSGFIGSHVADQTLAAGYKVRGTARSKQKSRWVEDYFKSKYGSDQFELVDVPDMTADGAFDQAVKGAAGFIHVANDMTHSTDPNIAIPRAVKGAINALAASAKEPSLKRFVYTSSSFAVTLPKPGKKFTVTAETFNEESVKRAWEPNASGDAIYAASKVEAERAMTKWLDENKTSLAVNTILPNANIGPILSPANQGYPTTASWVKAIWDSKYDALKDVPPQHYVHVQDDARLHVIALINPAVQGERIFAVTGPFTLNDIVTEMRKLFPERTWESVADNGRDLSVFEGIDRAEKLLKEAYGVGFIAFEDCVRGNAAALAGEL